jgi:hypothetical protein
MSGPSPPMPPAALAATCRRRCIASWWPASIDRTWPQAARTSSTVRYAHFCRVFYVFFKLVSCLDRHALTSSCKTITDGKVCALLPRFLCVPVLQASRWLRSTRPGLKQQELRRRSGVCVSMLLRGVPTGNVVWPVLNVQVDGRL